MPSFTNLSIWINCFNKLGNSDRGTIFGPSDGPNMVPLYKLEDLLKQLSDIDNLIKN